ncbi:UNKNOWN [Stylonychia lemnae]|uniref:Uncharacterized protein n=1 Tax=Stylonychia lemnae TaxID=5949 RepID=A0A078B7Z1_STYLE|nr:UNKNOWN [Stylonychia lemnae]|eukprot:CDW90519.1 UNKNOWN [Stylonychia lemnae]
MIRKINTSNVFLRPNEDIENAALESQINAEEYQKISEERKSNSDQQRKMSHSKNQDRLEIKFEKGSLGSGDLINQPTYSDSKKNEKPILSYLEREIVRIGTNIHTLSQKFIALNSNLQNISEQHREFENQQSIKMLQLDQRLQNQEKISKNILENVKQLVDHQKKQESHQKKQESHNQRNEEIFEKILDQLKLINNKLAVNMGQDISHKDDGHLYL